MAPLADNHRGLVILRRRRTAGDCAYQLVQSAFVGIGARIIRAASRGLLGPIRVDRPSNIARHLDAQRGKN